MVYKPVKKIMLVTYLPLSNNKRKSTSFLTFTFKQSVLMLCLASLLLGYFLFSQRQSDAYAANPGNGNICSWHNIVMGDTLSSISSNYHTSIWSIAQANHLANPNLIIVGHRLCIPYNATRTNGMLLQNNALENSSQAQVAFALRQMAARYSLPARLMLAIGWQESGWNQGARARDGGIGVMQIMPGTASGLNRQTGIYHNPYTLWGNVELGAIYLRSLWSGFHGNLAKIISAYNEGGWNVLHRGIFNWGYVNSVLNLMRRY